jgi:hypothetical protein
MGRSDADRHAVDALLDAYVRYLEGTGKRPELDGVDPATRAEADELFRLLDATWGSDADLPPFESDPVAIALGFVSPPPADNLQLSGPKLSRQRQRRNFKPSQLAALLAKRGVTTTTRQLAQLESLPIAEVDNHTLVSLAEILGCPVSDLTAGADALADDFVAWLHSSEFESEVTRWAKEHEFHQPTLAAEARTRLLSARQRSGGQADRDKWVALLRSVLNTFL